MGEMLVKVFLSQVEGRKKQHIKDNRERDLFFWTTGRQNRVPAIWEAIQSSRSKNQCRGKGSSQ